MSRGYTGPAPKDSDDLINAYNEASKLNMQAKHMSAKYVAICSTKTTQILPLPAALRPPPAADCPPHLSPPPQI